MIQKILITKMSKFFQKPSNNPKYPFMTCYVYPFQKYILETSNIFFPDAL